MGKENNIDYLDSKEQFIIAAKVNRICSAEAAQVDEALITDMQAVIDALEPRMGYSSHHELGGFINTPGSKFVGETQHGQLSVQSGENEKKFKIGVKEYRTGNYIAIKLKGKNNFEDLSFEPYFGAGGANLTLGKIPVNTIIEYRKRNDINELVALKKGNPKSSKLAGGIVIRYKYTYVWVNEEYR